MKIASSSANLARKTARTLNAFLPIVAVFDDGAALARRVAGAADFASVADEIDVE